MAYKKWTGQNCEEKNLNLGFLESSILLLTNIWSTYTRNGLSLWNVTKQINFSAPYFKHFRFYGEWEIYGKHRYTIYD